MFINGLDAGHLIGNLTWGWQKLRWDLVFQWL